MHAGFPLLANPGSRCIAPLSPLQQAGQQGMRGHAEGIGYGDAVPSESLLQIFREEQAAPALGGGGKDDAVPETETVRGSEFGSTHDHGFGSLNQRESVTPTENRGARLRGRGGHLWDEKREQLAERLHREQ